LITVENHEKHNSADSNSSVGQEEPQGSATNHHQHDSTSSVVTNRTSATATSPVDTYQHSVRF
jgi:hypothetical protein